MKIFEPLIAASLMTFCVAAWADNLVPDDADVVEVSDGTSPEIIGDKFEGIPDKEAVREDSPTVAVAGPDAP